MLAQTVTPSVYGRAKIEHSSRATSSYIVTVRAMHYTLERSKPIGRRGEAVFEERCAPR